MFLTFEAMSEKKLFLLDGMALIYRAFFAFSKNPRITSTGLNTSAMFGFTNTLLDVISKQKPTHIAVVFDTDKPTERHEIFEDYKAHREAMPEDLSKSIPYIFRIIEGFKIPVLTMDGYEADDIIGTLAKKAEKAGFKTYMMTPDKDFAQLVTDSIFIHKPARMGNDTETLGVKEVLEKWEIKDVSQVIDILGLWGDAVDNIPGVPGVGEKTAKKLIADFGSVENIIANTDKLQGKLKEKFEEFAPQALLSKKLATIITDVPIELNEKELELEQPDKEKLKEIFIELEFRTLAQKIIGDTATNTPKSPNIQGDLFATAKEELPDEPGEAAEQIILKNIDNTPHHYKLIKDTEGVKRLIEQLQHESEFCFDTETTALSVLEAKVIGVAISWKKYEAYYIALTDENRIEILNLLQPILEGKQLKIAQNLKYDLMALQNHGIKLKEPWFDSMLAHYLLEPDQRHNMDLLARQYLSYEPVSIETLIGKKGKNQITMDKVELEKIKEYAAEDADITLQLKQIFTPMLLQQQVKKVFEEIEMPLVPVLANMEREGIKVDTEFLKDYSKQLQQDIIQTEKNIYSLAGAEFNIASPKQLGEILFDKLGLDDKAKTTKTGQYKTDEDTLLKLSGKHEIVKEILEFRSLQKLKSTYVDALPELVNKNTGRVHTSLNQAVAATGRLSSQNPNLQNIPVRTERGREVRKAFVPRNEDYLLMSADYSQIELRVIASISNDSGMIEAFNNNQDIHTATAAKVFGVPISDVTKEQRYKAKSVNFGLIYGQGAFGLAENLGISRTEAKEIIDNYFKQFPGIRKYMDETINFARQHGYVQTIKGRRRYLRDINSRNATIRAFAERNAINAPIQGSAADMIKIAMININNEMHKQKLKSKMILQVHDELLFDVHKSEEEVLKDLVTKEMANAMPLTVPVIAEAGVGKNWLEAH